MIFSQSQIIYIFINVLLILFGVGLTFLLIKVLKIKDKPSRLLFVLYIIYWIAPLVTRDYTGLIQIHMNINNALLLFIPITVYGLIGVFYRPLSDILTLRMGSRKKVIYISLLLQLLMAIPFFAYPCFGTNVVQSIGAGIGASCIGLFNLMFNEQQAKRKIAYSVSILVIPPLIAQLFASAFICIIVSIVHASHTGYEYVDIVKYLWLIAIVMIVASFVLAYFVKEKKETLYQKGATREVVENKKDYIFFILICLCAALISFSKWIVGGATASVQIAYVANKTAVDTRAYEGYASLAGSVGQLVGVVASSLWLTFDNRTRHKRVYLLLMATIIGILYFVLNSIWVDIPMFILSGLLNGLSYGIFANILLGIILSMMFKKRQRLITPVGVYNTALAIGIVGGTFANCFIKEGIFDQMHGFSTYSFDDFKHANTTVNILGACAVVLAFAIFMIAKLINKHNKHRKVKIKKQFAVTSDTEM